MDFFDSMAELTNQDDSVAGVEQMERLVALLGQGPLGRTEQELVSAALLATTDAAVLETFVRGALERLHEWLTTSVQEDPSSEHTKLLFKLLGRLPISVEVLQKSGVGKTMNRMRKSANGWVMNAATEILRSWKAVVSGPSAPAEAPSKRALPSAGEHDPKRARAVPAAADAFQEASSSLDSMLNAQSQARKSSLKPDHLKARRPVQKLNTSITSGRRAAVPSGELSPTASSVSAPLSVPHLAVPLKAPASAPVPPPAATQAATPTPAMPSSAQQTPIPLPTATTPASSLSGRAGRRISWAADDKLVEMREYVVEKPGHSMVTDPLARLCQPSVCLRMLHAAHERHWQTRSRMLASPRAGRLPQQLLRGDGTRARAAAVVTMGPRC